MRAVRFLHTLFRGNGSIVRYTSLCSAGEFGSVVKTREDDPAASETGYAEVSYFIFNCFPIPRPGRDDAPWRRVVELAGRLACPDDRFAAWAGAVGVDCGPLAADEKDDMIHELDAVAARLYGLKEAQLVHIFETFHEKWDYGARLEDVLRHFRKWGRR